jgi:PatG C-terminal
MQFAPAAAELFDRIMLMADNAGATDEHRALNYLTVRYPAIYSMASDAFARNASLDNVEVRSSTLSGTRNIVDVIHACRRDRKVSLPGDKNVTLLRPLS